MVIEREDISKKNATVTAILCLFFGSLGAHNFYCGRYLKGIIYCMFGGTLLGQRILARIGIQLFGFPKAVLLLSIMFMLVVVAILYDLYALYSDSFFDSSNKLVLSGKQKDEIYGRSLEEKSEERMDTAVTLLLTFAIYIIFFLLYIYVL